jgi:hypothetical protein
MKDKKRLTERRALDAEKLPVELTEDEIRTRHQALADLLDQIDKTKAEHAQKLKTLKDSNSEIMGELTATLREVRDQLKKGTEERLIECEQVLDFQRRRAEIIRLDTGELVRTRPLTADELQTKLAEVVELKAVSGGKESSEPQETLGDLAADLVDEFGLDGAKVVVDAVLSPAHPPRDRVDGALETTKAAPPPTPPPRPGSPDGSKEGDGE